jgi:hypothetical protein
MHGRSRSSRLAAALAVAATSKVQMFMLGYHGTF